jgi:hypothetical protein
MEEAFADLFYMGVWQSVLRIDTPIHAFTIREQTRRSQQKSVVEGKAEEADGYNRGQISSPGIDFHLICINIARVIRA